MTNKSETGFLKSFHLQVVSIGLIILLIIFASYYTGKLMANNTHNKAQFIQLKELKTLENELTSTRNRLTIAENTNSINIQSIEQTRLTILQLEQQIYQQQKDIISYKAILSKRRTETNLVFRDFIIQETEKPQIYRYKLILTRHDQANILLKGTLHIFVVGTLNNKVKTLSLSDITSETDHKKVLSFSFRYIEMIPAKDQFAELTLPKNFIPKTIKITAYLSGNSKPITHNFDWLAVPSPT